MGTFDKLIGPGNNALSTEGSPSNPPHRFRIAGRPLKESLAQFLTELGDSADAFLIREFTSAAYRIPQLESSLCSTKPSSDKDLKRIRSELNNLRSVLAVADSRLLKNNPESWKPIRSELLQTSQMLKNGVPSDRFLTLQKNITLLVTDTSSHPHLVQNVQGAMRIPNDVKNQEKLFVKAVGQSISYMEEYAGRFKKTKEKQHSPLDPVTLIRVCKEENFPIELFLALSLVESGGGLLGRGAASKNPLNFGNDDHGHTKTYDSWEAGIRGCIQGMRRAGFRGEFSTIEDILNRKKLKGFYGFYCPPKGAAYATEELRQIIRELLKIMDVRRSYT